MGRPSPQDPFCLGARWWRAALESGRPRFQSQLCPKSQFCDPSKSPSSVSLGAPKPVSRVELRGQPDPGLHTRQHPGCAGTELLHRPGVTPLPSVSLSGGPYTPTRPEPCCAHLQGPQFPSLPRGCLSPQTPRPPITHPGEQLRTWVLGSEGPKASPYLHFSTSKMPVSRVWGPPQCRRGGVRPSPEEPTVAV